VCTDLRLVRLEDLHVSGRTMDFAQELGSRVQVVPVGNEWSATATGTPGPALTWTNAHGYVAMDAFSFDWAACDGLNDAGLSIGTLPLERLHAVVRRARPRHSCLLRAQLRRVDDGRPRPRHPWASLIPTRRAGPSGCRRRDRVRRLRPSAQTDPRTLVP